MFEKLEAQKQKFGNFNCMSLPLLFVLNELAKEFDISINNGFEDGHAVASYHSRYGVGGAADFVVKTSDAIDVTYLKLKTKLDTFNCPYRLGVYPHWNTPGFHLDLAEGSQDKNNPHKNEFWVKTKLGSYKYQYDFAKSIIDLRMDL